MGFGDAWEGGKSKKNENALQEAARNKCTDSGHHEGRENR